MFVRKDRIPFIVDLLITKNCNFQKPYPLKPSHILFSSPAKSLVESSNILRTSLNRIKSSARSYIVNRLSFKPTANRKELSTARFGFTTYRDNTQITGHSSPVSRNGSPVFRHVSFGFRHVSSKWTALPKYGLMLTGFGSDLPGFGLGAAESGRILPKLGLVSAKFGLATQGLGLASARLDLAFARFGLPIPGFGLVLLGFGRTLSKCKNLIFEQKSPLLVKKRPLTNKQKEDNIKKYSRSVFGSFNSKQVFPVKYLKFTGST